VTPRHPDAIGAIAVACAAVLVIAAGLTTPDPGFGVVGPAAFPLVIGGLLLVCAAWLGFDPLRGAAAPVLEDLDRRPFFATLAAMGLFFAAFLPAGFVVSAIPYLVVQSRIFGSRALLRDCVVAVAFVVALDLLFVRFLTIDLPHGPLPF